MSRQSIRVATLLIIALLVAAPASAGDAEAGRVTYETLCFTCHGMTGKGDGPAGIALTPPPRDFSLGDFAFDADNNGVKGEDADLRLVITQGAGAFGGNPSMAPWGHLSEQQIEDVIAHVRTLKVAATE